MISELRQVADALEEMHIKEKAAEDLCILLDNAIGYMMENGMNQNEIAEYLGCSVDTLNYIHTEDYEAITKEGK